MKISIDRLFFNRKEKNILSDVSVTIPGNEVTVITGGNGCGKSTLLKLIAGLLKPDEGNISFDENDIAGFSPAQLARMRAILLQNPDVPGAMTVMELLKLSRFAFHAGKKDDEYAIETALHDTGSSVWRDRQLRTLSGGELRKVFLALALAQEPQLLLLDEVEAGLDAEFRSAFPVMLKKWQETRDLTVVMVMHDFDLALHCADNILALEDGKVNFFSPVTAVDFSEKLDNFTGKYFTFHQESGKFRALLNFSGR